MSVAIARGPLGRRSLGRIAMPAVAALLAASGWPVTAQAATPPPSAPALVAPVGGASVTQPITLKWGQSTGARPIVAYAWEVSSNSAFTAVKVAGNAIRPSDTAPAPTQAALSGLPNGAYFWRVNATQDQADPVEGLVTGPWSATGTFTINGSAPGVLPAPSMTGPPDLFQYHPYEFVRNAWTAVPGVHHYLLEYDNESSFSLPLFNADYSPIPASETTHPIMFGEPVGNLWFRVRAVAADGTRSLPSNVRRVTITYTANDIPPAPILTGPPNGASGMLPVTFDWADDANPQSYELQIGGDPAFAQANAAECTGVDWCVRGIPESQWTAPTLPTGTRYWRVRSEHGDKSPTEPALSAWSAVRSFTVQQTPPSIKSLQIDVMTDNGLTVRSHTNAPSGTTPDNSVYGRLDLTATVPPEGTVVTLTSSNPSVASVPASITVPPASSLDATDILASFPIDPKQVTVSKTVTITASLPTGSKSVPLTVDPPSIRRIQIGSNSEPVQLSGGQQPTTTLLLNGAAPAGGATITYSSSNPSLIPAPASVSLPAGGSTASFTLATSAVSAATTVTLTATWKSSSYSVAITLHPAPTLLAPAAGATFAPGDPVRFDWTDELVADEIQISTSPSFAAPLVSDQFLYQTSEYTTTSLPSGQLYWRARAMDADYVGGPWSATSTITITGPTAPPPPLAAPALSSPANGGRVTAGGPVAFRWSGVSGAASYQLQVDDTSSFAAPLVVNQTVVGATQFTVNSLAKGNRFWRVRALDSSGNPGVWSTVRSLTVK
jgi:hypothetical protein